MISDDIVRAGVESVNRISGGDMKFLTVAATSERLGYAKETVRRMIAQGRLPAVRLPSGRLRIAEADVEALLKPVRGGER